MRLVNALPAFMFIPFTQTPFLDSFFPVHMFIFCSLKSNLKVCDLQVLTVLKLNSVCNSSFLMHSYAPFIAFLTYSLSRQKMRHTNCDTSPVFPQHLFCITLHHMLCHQKFCSMSTEYSLFNHRSNERREEWYTPAQAHPHLASAKKQLSGNS